MTLTDLHSISRTVKVFLFHYSAFPAVFLIIVLLFCLWSTWNNAGRGDQYRLAMYSRWSRTLPPALQLWADVWHVPVTARCTVGETSRQSTWPEPVVRRYVVCSSDIPSTCLICETFFYKCSICLSNWKKFGICNDVPCRRWCNCWYNFEVSATSSTIIITVIFISRLAEVSK